MQVADSTELTTSATLGAQDAMAFGISEDPAFFQILSANLYSNQKLAMVRETLCNSWDAHIEGNKTDIPIHVTIDKDGFLIFRDYGSGIPKDKIQEVYGVYGASTKKANTASTGGFGLGCKSPMAYTDSFTVTSMCDGTKTVYHIAKSSVETNGKPGIIPIVSVPTEESGLEVKIQLQSEDILEIDSYIRAIVLHGEIKCIYCNQYTGPNTVELLPVLGMSFEPGSYNLDHSTWHKYYMGSHSIFIRYGNVIYPALDTPATHEALKLVKQFMQVINCSRIVVQAAPSSLAVAPSRETLSSQKMTEDGIVNLAVALVDKMEADIKARLPNAIEYIGKAIKEYSPHRFEVNSYLPYTNLVPDVIVSRYMSSTLFSKQYAHLCKKWGNMEIDRQLEHPALAHFSGSQKAHLRKHLKRAKDLRNYRELTKVFTDMAIKPMFKTFAKLGITKGISLFHYQYGVELWRNNIVNSVRRIHSLNFMTYSSKKCRVFVTPRITNIEDSLAGYPEFDNLSTETLVKYNSIIVKVGTKKGEAEAMTNLLTKAGYEVINMAEYHEWDCIARRRKEEQEAKLVISKLQAKKATNKKKVSPNRLISMNILEIPKEHRSYSSEVCGSHYASRSHDRMVDVDTPQYYIMQEDINNYTGRLGVLSMWQLTPATIKDVTVVCRNKIERNKAIKRGAVHLDEWTAPYIASVLTSKQFIKYVTKERQKTLSDIGIYSKHLRLLRELDITYAPLKGLRYDPELENAYLFLQSSSYPKLRALLGKGLITEEEYHFLSDVDVHCKTFSKYSELRRIPKMFLDIDAGGYMLAACTVDTLLREIEQFPESIPAIKLLVKAALKRNTD